MDKPGARLRQLQQIPVFALRQLACRLLEERDSSPGGQGQLMEDLIRKADESRKSVQRMNREQLTSLIDASPGVNDKQIERLFEEYRYGSNPSFYVQLFDKTRLGRQALQGFRQRFEEQLERFNAAHEEGLPRLRRIALNDLTSLPERPEITEGIYRFQSRTDYIDERENAVSTYQTLYGFFWLNVVEGYVIIHARNSQVLKVLKQGIEKGANVKLSALIISKQLKNALPFLLRDSFRAGRLHDPNPGPGRFRWLTVADDNPYAKGYQELEERYPEVRTAQYREVIDGYKETTLTIRSNRGALSLAGTLKASQIRAWCLDRLGQLISVLNEFRPNAPAYVPSRELTDVPELARYNPKQRKAIQKIISALLTVKQSPLVGYQPLGLPAISLAVTMGRWMRAQIPLEGAEGEEQAEGYLACPMCESAVFTLKHRDGQLQLECREHERQPWRVELPLAIEQGEDDAAEIYVDEESLAESIELLPDEGLAESISEIVDRYLPGYTFDARIESFLVRGPNLIYYPDRSKVYDSQLNGEKTVIYVTQKIANLKGGEVIGVSTDPAEV